MLATIFFPSVFIGEWFFFFFRSLSRTSLLYGYTNASGRVGVEQSYAAGVEKGAA